MRHLKLIAVAGILSVSAISLSAHARPNADANNDGQITQAEFTAAAQEKFAKTDINGDGYLSQEERQAFRANMESEKRASRFDKMDTNGDGFVSRSEYEAQSEDRRDSRREKIIQRFDTNQNGQVDDAEREAMRERMAKFRKDNGPRSERRKDRRGGPDGRGAGGGDHWTKIDVNGDGLISTQEHATGANQMFDRMDADGDGVLTAGEAKRKRHKKRRRMFNR